MVDLNCIELDKPVEVKKGSTFAVVVKVNNAYITLSENEGGSYVYRGGWTPSQAVRIKVFTKNDEKIRILLSLWMKDKLR